MKYVYLLQVLSNPDEEAVQRQIRTYSLIFVGVGVYSGITNFIMVSRYDLPTIYIQTKPNRKRTLFLFWKSVKKQIYNRIKNLLFLTEFPPFLKGIPNKINL